MSHTEKCHPLYPYTMSDKEQILKELELNESAIEDSVDSILEWFRKQAHLMETGLIEREIVERMLIIAKGSIERTKQRIEGLYKYRYSTPELIKTREKLLNDPEREIWDIAIQAPIPKIFKGKRITVTIFKEHDINKFHIATLFTNAFMLTDLRLKHDYALNDIWVFDLKNTTFSHVLRLNPITSWKASTLFHSGYALRVSCIHIINCFAAAQAAVLIKMLKQHFNPKILERIMIHEKPEDLFEHIPKEYLPKDLGGYERSMQEIKEFTEKIIREPTTKHYLLEVKDKCSKQAGSLDVSTEDFLVGSFKKLEFD